MTDLIPLKRALLSVSDKSGLIELAGALDQGRASHGAERKLRTLPCRIN